MLLGIHNSEGEVWSNLIGLKWIVSKTTLEKESAFQRTAAFDQKSLLPGQEETGRRNRAEPLERGCFQLSKDKRWALGGLAATAEQPRGITPETLGPAVSERHKVETAHCFKRQTESWSVASGSPPRRTWETQPLQKTEPCWQQSAGHCGWQASLTALI